MLSQFEARPETVKALQWTGWNYDELCAVLPSGWKIVEKPIESWCSRATLYCTNPHASCQIVTLDSHGSHNEGDWLIFHPDDRLTSMTNRDFHERYRSPLPATD